ncbi:hypothetical protein BCV70DRAFT_219099 [Testicularia cyperi]|uniref:Uncharacterized protein n=1 Tax=Testicularia cyperi TaxID=1882483 RepID=A0A317XI86_9BASI|nr:hypothetical protein BCV70DRAFT_219099 [Testicularia cyperi]
MSSARFVANKTATRVFTPSSSSSSSSAAVRSISTAAATRSAARPAPAARGAPLFAASGLASLRSSSSSFAASNARLFSTTMSAVLRDMAFAGVAA